MIINDSQLKASEAALVYLVKLLDEPMKKDIPEIVANASKRQIQFQIKEIKDQIEAHKKLKMAVRYSEHIKSFEDLLKIPITYRKAFGLTLDQFAREIEVSARQIARYEKEEYLNIGVVNLLKILKKIDLMISGKILFDKKNACITSKLELHSKKNRRAYSTKKSIIENTSKL